jgi:hypothetical protein
MKCSDNVSLGFWVHLTLVETIPLEPFVKDDHFLSLSQISV